ncbi:sporulation membrane protein YtaF [Paenibacillus sp. 1001270B_150601_E10]|uniref:sporulation membrane protein YtaF n=1 Tax=Paenibacillus sp. 1001270B_150601_E10 TaxID=2787079 RepID=UPI00189D90FE|nr:sporulation membrane protein YtaF [Paenibacillus sp. 1001270B_150601_E10]
MVAGMMILGFAMSSSLDNLGVGISYGIRGIRINHLSNFVIAAICFLLSMVGIVSGQWLSSVLPGVVPVLIGALLLFIVGIRIILLAAPRKPVKAEESIDSPGKSSLSSILRNPESVDKDQSGSIGLGEAVILGVALAANAVTNGVGAGLLGLSPLAISLTAAIGSYLSVWLGIALGQKVANIRIGRFTLGQFSTLLSGLIIVLIAVNTLLD